MSGCIKIRLQEVYDYVPAKYVEGGYVYFDTNPNFDVRETKQVTEINGEGQLSFNFSLGFDLPNSDKNFAILKRFLHSNVIDNNYEKVGVDIVSGSYVTTPKRTICKER